MKINAQITLTENFDYPAGDSIGAHGWITFSGSVNNIKVKSPGLVYTNYILSNIGNCARVSNNGIDSYKSGDSINSGAVYISFMVKVDSARSTGDYFIALLPNNSTTTYFLRIFAKDTLGGLCFGVSKYSTNATTLPVWGTTTFSYGVTYLIVGKYKFNTTSTTDDEVSLFVFTDPNVPLTEPPTPYAGPVTTTQTDVTNLSRIALRQGSATIAPSLDIDGIQGGHTWSDLFPSTPVPSSPTLYLPPNNSNGNLLNVNLVWSKPQGSTGYNVLVASDTAFTNIIVNDTTLTDSIKTVSGLNPLTTYYWKVRAKNTSGWGNYSGYFNFKTLGTPTQVILASPVNNSTNQPVNITFKWYKSIDQIMSPNVISNYWFELASDITFQNIISKDSTLTDTTKSISGLNNNSTYYWRVKAKNQIGWGTFSSPWNFTTILGLPGAPVLFYPPNYAGVTQPITFVWRKAVETLSFAKNESNLINRKILNDNSLTVSNYWFECASDSLFSTIISRDSSLTDTTKTLSGFSTGVFYYWRVKAKNQIGWGPFSSVWRFGVQLPIPSAPVLTSPANGATCISLTALLDWADVVGASGFRIQITTDSTFNNITTYDTSGVTVSQLNIPSGKLLNYTKYYWRVNATNTSGTSPWSAAWNFTTILSTPVLISPLNNSTGVSVTPLLDWGDVTGASSYRVQVSTDSTFSSTAWDSSGITLSQVNVPSGKLLNGTLYFWRVNASNAGCTSSWSAMWRFATIAAGLPLNLKAYLEGFWNGTTHVPDTVSIYLASGSVSYTLVDSQKVILGTAGTTNPTFMRVSSGSYYIVLKHRNHLETWSRLPQPFVAGVPLSYDFTTDSAKAYGFNMKKVGSVWVIFGGDPNQDGDINALDVPIFVGQFGSSGYLSCDFNGDGDVNALDVVIISANFGRAKYVPGLLEEPVEFLIQKKSIKQKELLEIIKNQNKIKENN